MADRFRISVYRVNPEDMSRKPVREVTYRRSSLTIPLTTPEPICLCRRCEDKASSRR